jgi:hypothetical protein
VARSKLVRAQSFDHARRCSGTDLSPLVELRGGYTAVVLMLAFSVLGAGLVMTSGVEGRLSGGGAVTPGIGGESVVAAARTMGAGPGTTGASPQSTPAGERYELSNESARLVLDNEGRLAELTNPQLARVVPSCDDGHGCARLLHPGDLARQNTMFPWPGVCAYCGAPTSVSYWNRYRTSTRVRGLDKPRRPLISTILLTWWLYSFGFAPSRF